MCASQCLCFHVCAFVCVKNTLILCNKNRGEKGLSLELSPMKRAPHTHTHTHDILSILSQ